MSSQSILLILTKLLDPFNLIDERGSSLGCTLYYVASYLKTVDQAISSGAQTHPESDQKIGMMLLNVHLNQESELCMGVSCLSCSGVEDLKVVFLCFVQGWRGTCTCMIC